MQLRVAALLVIFLLIGQVGVISELNILEMNHSSNSIPSSLSFENIIEDTYFDSEPSTVINGTSGEFSSNYHHAADEEDFNYIELTWDHVANTPLDFRVEADADGVLPDCFDFIYFYQEFDWPSNEIPLEAEFNFNLSTTLEGSFATEPYGNLMFKVYVWMIDSSGNWILVYDTRDAAYSESYQDRRVNFNYIAMQQTWGGMIENSSGLQEDPEDVVQVAIGLAPRFYFESFQYIHPWEFYNGAVSIRISGMELWVYMDQEPDPSQVLTPLYNSTWEYSLREVFPDIPEEYENSTDWFKDIQTDADGSVYVLCDTSSSYEYFNETGRSYSSQFLLRYSTQLELLWAKPLGNMTHGHALTVHDGYIYTTGYISTDDEYHNLIVAKWSSDGDIVWQTEWGGIYTEEGSAITVAPDNSVYVWAAYYNNRFEPEFWKSSFLKFDSAGILLWNKTSVVPLMPVRAMLEMQPDGMYSWDTYNVEKRNLTCEPIWNISRIAFAANFDERGNIYVAAFWYWKEPEAIFPEWGTTISKWNSDGVELWHSNYSIPLTDGNYMNFRCGSIDVAPDGSVLAILHEMELTYEYHIVKLDSTGVFIWDKIIGDKRWPVYGGAEPILHMAENGLAYVGYQRYGDYGIEVAVWAFIVGPYNQGIDSQLLIIVGVSGAALVAVILVCNKKYK